MISPSLFGAIWGAWVLAFEGAKKKGTNLDQLVPTSRNNHRVLGVRGEPDARNPLGVTLVGDGELAVTEGVPELD